VATVSFQNINKQYPGGFHAVRDLNLEIADGEFVVLVGPSGCGKSTTLRMLAGLEEITSGEIRIGDRRVNDVEPGQRDIAMVFQNYALYPHMTVHENLAFGLKMRRTPKAEIARRTTETAETLGITSLLQRKPRELSGAPSCGSRRFFCLTNPSRTSTRSFASRCGPRSRRSISGSARR
jgi:ABC-type sugar transport system ATPase subunit